MIDHAAATIGKDAAEIRRANMSAAGDEGHVGEGKMLGAGALAGTNCIKIGLPGKLILSKRKGLREAPFS